MEIAHPPVGGFRMTGFQWGNIGGKMRNRIECELTEGNLLKKW